MQWYVDDRAATWWTRLYVSGMWARRDDEAFSGAAHTRRVAEDRQRKGDRPPTRLTRLLCRVRRVRRGGMTCWLVRPRRGRPRVRVVHLHGGGYIHPLTADYWRLVRAYAASPAEVVVPAYPLAPGHTVDEVVPALLDLLDEVDDGLPLVLSGDSAGGALALVLAQRRPADLVLALCPWLDPRLVGDEVDALDPTDPMLEESGLRSAAWWWAGDRDVTDPLVSPLRGPMADLPAVQVHIGDHDILRPAVDDLARIAQEQGVDLTVYETRAMFHVWMTRLVPEGRRTRRQLREAVRASAR